MKIIEHTSTSLILKDSAGRILLAALCILAIAGTTFAGLADLFITYENKVNEYGTTLILLFSVVGLAIGGCIINDHPLVYIKLNKLIDKGTIHRIGLLKNENRVCQLSDIEDIIITESEGSEGNIFYGVAVKLKDDGLIPLSAACWEYDGSQLENANMIKRFLKNNN